MSKLNNIYVRRVVSIFNNQLMNISPIFPPSHYPTGSIGVDNYR